jgi:hypothetical protein
MTSKTVRTLGVLSLASLSLAACSKDTLNLTNPNSPSVDGAASDPQTLQLQATGVLRGNRGSLATYQADLGRFGRESYSYTPAEGRNTSAYLIGFPGQNRLDPGGFAVGSWAGPYGNLRDIFNFRKTVDASTAFTDAQKRGATGFAKTIEAMELMYVVATRDTLGGIVQINEDPQVLAPFVSRDSMYKYILNTLDGAQADLTAAGTAAFPFTMHSGYAGFNTPATFLRFNRAMAARAAAYYATVGGGATAWTRAGTALAASFINTGATTAAALNVGVYQVQGAAPDTPNPFNMVTNTTTFAHMSIQADAPRKADGTFDNRYLAKIGTRAQGNAPQGLGIPSTLGFNMYPTVASPTPIIRNEELILLRAEILLATGDKQGAIDMINVIRVNSGGLAPTTLTAAAANDAILTEILLQKRYSLLLEGHRWVDMRRYGRLNQLPIDITTGVNTHFVARVQPLPTAECQQRVGQTGALAGPGC